MSTSNGGQAPMRQVLFRLPPAEYAALEALATRKNRPVSTFLRDAVNEYLIQHEQEIKAALQAPVNPFAGLLG